MSGLADEKECFDGESNTGPSDLQSDALPTELSKLSLLKETPFYSYTNLRLVQYHVPLLITSATCTSTPRISILTHTMPIIVFIFVQHECNNTNGYIIMTTALI
jgi:hypothetical protein